MRGRIERKRRRREREREKEEKEEEERDRKRDKGRDRKEEEEREGEIKEEAVEHTSGQPMSPSLPLKHVDQVILPLTLHFAGSSALWGGKVMNPEELPDRFKYASQVQEQNRERLQELLDSAKKGQMGGHWANDSWTKAPESEKKGPWNAPVRIPRTKKPEED